MKSDEVISCGLVRSFLAVIFVNTMVTLEVPSVSPADVAFIPGQHVTPDGSPNGGGVEHGVGVTAEPAEHQQGQTQVLQLRQEPLMSGPLLRTST